jgi:hypothetical protein
MYYKVIVISEEAKGHVSDKERKLVLNYKSTVELNEFGLQLLLKDFTPYNIIVVKVDKPHNRKGHHYETTDNLSTLCEKIRKFVVTGDVEEEHDECRKVYDIIELPSGSNWLCIKDKFVNTLGYLFFKMESLNPLYTGIDHKYLVEKLNEKRLIFNLSKNGKWIYTKDNYISVEIREEHSEMCLVLTKEVHYKSKQIVHREFRF